MRGRTAVGRRHPETPPADRRAVPAPAVSQRAPRRGGGRRVRPDFARPFLDDQFKLQTAHFDRAYRAGSRFSLVMCKGSAIGRLYLHETDDALHVVDISLLPEWRGHGIGGALLRDVLERAAASGKSASLSVDKRNTRALALYRWLGFVQAKDTGADLLLRWRAPERSR